MPVINWSITLYIDGVEVGLVYYVSQENCWHWGIHANPFGIAPKSGVDYANLYPGEAIKAAEKYVESQLSAQAR